MIISEEYNFLFVHIPKTAGSSVADAFRKYGRPRARPLSRSISRKLPIKESPSHAHFRVHDPARKIINKLSRPVFDSFLSFTVVRDPFEHAVSHYEYMKQFRIKSTARMVGKMSFTEYLQFRKTAPAWRVNIFARAPSQSAYVTDKNGNLLVKRVVRFENLAPELEQLSNDLKLPKFELRHVNKTKADKKPTADYYSKEALDLVRAIYEPDFDLFGYSTTPKWIESQ